MANPTRDEDKLEVVLQRYFNRFRKFNTDVLTKIGETIAKFDGVSPSAAHKIAQQLKYGTTLNEIYAELEKITDLSAKEMEELFDLVAKDDIEFAKEYYDTKGVEYIPYAENDALVRYVKAVANTTGQNFLNISNTKAIGFTTWDNNLQRYVFRELPQIYNDVIDEAVFNVSRGVESYQSAMSKVIKQLAASGVKVNENKVGYGTYNRRIDSSVRQNVLEGLRRVNQETQRLIGEELDSDGVEISAHTLCAEDHVDIQGKQYTKKEFEKLQSELMRPIGMYNCRHFAFSIILSVQEPSYTNKQLKQYAKESGRTFTFDGKEYTAYEGTQLQRKLETAIRYQKDAQILAKAAGNNKVILESQEKITQLTQKYRELSNVAKIPTELERAKVSGYKRVAKNKLK